MPSKEDCENARFKFASAIENPHWIGPVPQYITVKKSRGPNLILTLRDKMWAPVEQWSGYIKGWAMTDLPNAKAINIGDK
ncbi:MAG: hypothetical protein GWO20_00645, partial [Candidatus Korarchaeota archaeon]|nr:hypothetical protein [Candidatus Korarchaeota archaeon]